MSLELIDNAIDNFIRGMLITLVIFSFVVISGNSFANPIDNVKSISLNSIRKW